MRYYMLYAKLPGQKRFRPVDWRGARQVFQRIRATMFKAEQVPRLKEIIQEELERKGRGDGIVPAGFKFNGTRYPWEATVKWDNIQWELRRC